MQPSSSSRRQELRRPLLLAINDEPHIVALPSPPERPSLPNSSSPTSPYPDLSAPTSPSPGSSLASSSSSPGPAYVAPLLPAAPIFTRQLSESTAKKLAQGNFFRQLPAMLWKNALLKVRFPLSFFMEIVSPLVVLSILVMGWILSREGVQTVGSMVYANDTQIVNSLFNDVVIVPSGTSAANGSLCYTTKTLPPGTSFCFAATDVQLLNDVLDYDGPTSVPSIDDYIALHRAFVLATANSSSPAETIAALDSLTDNQLTNLIYLGVLAFTPNTTAVRALLADLNSTHLLFGSLKLRVFPSEEAAVADVLSLQQRYWAVVSFNVLDLPGGHVDYTIRMNYTALPSTSTTVSKFQLGLDRSYKRYLYSGFLTLQNMIDTAILRISAKDDYSRFPAYRPNQGSGSQPPARPLSSSSSSSALPLSSPPSPPPNNSAFLLSANLTTVPMPTPGYQGSDFYSTIGPVISLVMAMCMLFPVSRLIKGIVEEKEGRTKETMKMMGLLDSVFVASWFISSLLQFSLIAVLITLLLHFTLFPNTSLSLLFVFVWTFTLSEITFSFLVTVFFSSAKVAGIVGPLLLFACCIPRYAFFDTDPNEEILGKTLVSLLSPTAFTLGADLLINYEGVNLGLSWSGVEDDAFSLLRVLLVLMFDTCLYGWLAWYLEHVLPTSSMQPLPFYFCLQPSFWLKSYLPPPIHDVQQHGDDCDPAFIEPVPPHMADLAAVVTTRLRKVFKEGRGRSKRETVAVHSLDLTFYEGQITALLGHNGAGKTTTISMLTGLLSPNSGDCLMYGNSIVEDMSLIRKSLGVCSQQDVLFDRLSVEEHLQLYANLKGVEKDKMREEVERYLQQVGLEEKRSAWAGSLSGGQKRKLCVALALIGGSRIVFLDEPTSGMDPYSRRHTWEVLRLNKEGRVIIFTSHFMDEADILADRIAIMSDGRLRCCGSSLFLKSRFGIGYNLTMTRARKRWKPLDVTRTMLKYIPEAHLLSAAGGELSYRLPLASVSSFPHLFKEIDRKRARLGIGSYGISMTTLEEVFMRISTHKQGEEMERDAPRPGSRNSPTGQGSIREVERKDDAAETGESDGISPIRKPSLTTSFLLSDTRPEESNSEILARTRQRVAIRTQLWELFRKRYICALRDLSGKFYETILPVLVVALVLLILKLNVNPAGPEILLDSALYTAVQSDAVLSFDDKDLSSASPYVYTETMRELENGTFFFLEHRPAIRMRASPYPTSLDISQLDLLPTVKTHSGSRYGCLVLNDTLYTRFNWTSGGVAKNDVALQVPLTLVHNASYIHALPVLSAELQQARFAANRYMHGRPGWNDSSRAVVYLVRNHPFPLTARENIRIQTYLTLFAALFVMVPFCYLPASFVLFVVRERAVKSKHLQLVSGVSPDLYWLATMLWDSVNYLLVCVAVMLVFVGYGNAEFVGSVSSFLATFLLLLLYGLACTPLSYVYSFLFDNYTSAQVGIVGLHFLSGFGLIIMSFILDSTANTQQANQTLKQLYRLFPPFNLGEGLINLSTRGFTYLNTSVRPEAFAWEVVGRNLSWLTVEAFAYLALTLFIEHGSFWWMLKQLQLRQQEGDDEQPWKAVQLEDEDVLAERKRVEGTAAPAAGAAGDTAALQQEEGQPSHRASSRSSLPPNPRSPPPPRPSSPAAAAITVRAESSSPSPPTKRRSLSTNSSPPAGHRSLGSPYLSVPSEGEEEGVVRRKWSTDSLDSVSSPVVEAEPEPGLDVIRTVRLRKVWRRSGQPETVAVAGLSLGIPRGICFGFLGINGAGKTTTLKLLTGDEMPTSGSAFINQFNVVTQQSAVQKERGYCPQNDPLLDMLTGREQLGLFARLRGIPGRFVDSVVSSLLDRLGLGSICDRRCGSYSGGNKRKLSLAIAMVGDPSVLFLDEPSTGMDPVSRRFMWTVISAVADSRSVVLTSHSMEEVEALCNQVGIMVAGKLRCLGSIQHLKSRFGDNYYLDVNTAFHRTAQVKAYISRTFTGCHLEEEHAGRLKYSLPRQSVSLSHAFGSIEKVKQEMQILDYSISQSSLEQIFLTTVRKAEEAEHAAQHQPQHQLPQPGHC